MSQHIDTLSIDGLGDVVEGEETIRDCDDFSAVDFSENSVNKLIVFGGFFEENEVGKRKERI